MGDRDRRFAEAMNDLRSANLFGIDGKLVESFVEDYFVSPSPSSFSVFDEFPAKKLILGYFFQKKPHILPQNLDREFFVQQHNKARQKQKIQIVEFTSTGQNHIFVSYVCIL